MENSGDASSSESSSTATVTKYRCHIYETNQRAKQPSSITKPLKPHQLAAIHKAAKMECGEYIEYQITEEDETLIGHPGNRSIINSRNFSIRTNIGVLGDIVGFGKTLIALGVIAATPITDIWENHIGIKQLKSRASILEVTQRDNEDASDYMRIRSTLIVVPHGPVFTHWETSLREYTRLKYIAIDTMTKVRKLDVIPDDPHSIMDFFGKLDVVLVKASALDKFTEYFHCNYYTKNNPISNWSRLIVDEAHNIITAIPDDMTFKFMWLITSTYDQLITPSFLRKRYSRATCNFFNNETLYLMLVKNDPDFVHKSFTLPDMKEIAYICKMSHALSVVRPFLNPEVLDRINASDYIGAVSAMGGSNGTVEELVNLVTNEIKRDIRNKEREIAYVSEIDIPEAAKEQRLTNLRRELGVLQDRMKALVERIAGLDKKMCPICYLESEDPVMLSCTHSFCGNCILSWFRTRQTGLTCPECRQPVNIGKMVAVVSDEEVLRNRVVNGEQNELLSKEDTLMKIIRNKPNGRFLVFARHDSVFREVTSKLQEASITSCEMKGNSSVMLHNLEKFRNGTVRVILLNTFHAGSGIDISCATDVIVFHAMGIDKTQAVGRAYRVGRTEPLVVHNLYYPHESGQV